MNSWLMAPGGRLLEAAIPVGAFNGRGLYETFLRSDNEELIRAHLDRMRGGLKRLRITPPAQTTDEVFEMIAVALKSGETATFQRLRLTVFSNGPDDPSSLYLSGQKHTGYTAQQIEAGFRIAACPWRRDPECDLFEVKSVSVEHNLACRRFAVERDCDEGLFLSLESTVLEGAFSNFFAVMNGRLLTPPAHGILPGITRSAVLRLAAESLIEAREENVPIMDLIEGADEAFVTSSVIGVVPVKSIVVSVSATRDFGEAGRVTRLLQKRYLKYARGESA